MSNYNKDTFFKDLLASVVVFLVALPLCMGIAIASGAPPALGLISGIVGGLVVGVIGGSPLQVSGPAAGLAVLVWQFIDKFGLANLGWVVLGAGLIQLAAGALKIGRWFQAVSPAVIQGMLAGIGALIFSSQFHVMVDDAPRSNGIQNFLSIPEAIQKGIFPVDGSAHHLAAFIGILTIATIALWAKFKPKKLYAVPGPLVAVVLASVVAGAFTLPIQFVDAPDNLLGGLNVPVFGEGDIFKTSAFWGTVLGFALIASAETLLCAAAVDRMHDGVRTNYDKELFAQGIANSICGVVGALPITGVIVRSSANVEAGAKTRMSAILHGVWLVGLLVLVPSVIQLIPTSSLAAVLVFTGYKLVNIKTMKKLWQAGKMEAVIYGVTLVSIVVTDLLTGVLIGFGLSLARLLYTFVRLEVVTVDNQEEDRIDLAFQGAATFIQIPKMSEALESIDSNKDVHIHLGALVYADHATLELIGEWAQRRKGEVVVEWDQLKQRSKDRLVLQNAALPNLVQTAMYSSHK